MPSRAFLPARGTPSRRIENIEVLEGHQGGFDEIAINGGAAEGQPHPALLDINVRRAIAHGVDREAVIEDLWFGHATRWRR